MKMIPVSSSMILSIGYDEELMSLRVIFLDNSAYEYQGVSYEIYQSLLQAPSIGSYFSRIIRNQYAYVNVTDSIVREDSASILSSIRWCQEHYATVIFRTNSEVILRIESLEVTGYSLTEAVSKFKQIREKI